MKLRDTGTATAKLALPAWPAVTEHVPTATIVTVAPDTVQTGSVAELNAKGRLEVVLASREKGATPNATPAGVANVMVCEPAATVKLCVTGVAAV